MILKMIAPGDKIEIIRKTANEAKQRLYYSKIMDITSDTKMVIATPLDGGKIVALEVDGEYYLSIYSTAGLYRCEAQVTNRSKADNLYTTDLVIKTRMQKFQRRQYYRFDCTLPFNYYLEKSEKLEKGIIIDISGGGIRFKSNSQLIQDEIICCNLILDLGNVIKEIMVRGTIIASIAVDLKQDIFETRIFFEEIENDDREVIIKFIFEEERKRRKKEKGM